MQVLGLSSSAQRCEVNFGILCSDLRVILGLGFRVYGLGFRV